MVNMGDSSSEDSVADDNQVRGKRLSDTCKHVLMKKNPVLNDSLAGSSAVHF
jgi:hypothetical protein